MIDTNVFLEVLLLRSRKEECERFLEKLRVGEKKGVVTDFSIHTILLTMSRLRLWEELKIFLSALSAYNGLEIHVTSLADEFKAVDLSMKTKLNIEDAVQYSTALGRKVNGIVSFDRHFDGLEIPRMEPKDLETEG